MRNRKYVGAALALAILTMTSACSMGPVDNGPVGGDNATSSATVRIGLVGGVNTLDPHNTRSAGSDLSVLGSVYSSLVARQPDGSFAADAATEWADADEMTWTFQLDPDIVFANGNELTAESVKWNFDRVLEPSNGLRWAGVFTNIDHVEAPDETTVKVVLKRPDAEFLATLATFYLLDPEWAQSHDIAGEAMGSGPYELADYTKTGDIQLERKSDYWGEKPAIATVEFGSYSDRSALLAALLADEVDVISGIAPRDSDRFAGNKDAEVRTVGSARSGFLKFNTAKEPFTDVRVRQALNYAVDKQSIIDALFKGQVEPSNGQILTEAYDGYQAKLPAYPYDVKKAKRLLEEAGAVGAEIEVDMPTGTYIEGENVVQAIAAQLEKVGIKVKIQQLPFSTYMDKYVGQNADMAQSIYLSLAADSTGELLNYFKDGSPYAYWADQDFVSLLDTARYDSVGQSASERYAAAVDHMREQAPALFLFAQPASYGVAKNVDWKPRADGLIFPADMAIR